MTPNQKFVESLRASLGTSFADLASYLLLASAVWLFFYVLFRARLRHRKTSDRDPAPGQVKRELLQSLRSIAIFGLVAGVVVYAAWSGWTRMYLQIEKYGSTWFFVSIVLMIVIHDAYFYWTHRLMHHPRLFRRLHRAHHRSTSPTPWAAYAFSPGEALIQAGIGPLVVFAMPVHPAAFGLFMFWQIAFNVFGHCGFEIFPKWFLQSRIGLVLNSITHHSQHHEQFRANFGLYFNIWDRLMGTNHPEYEQRLAETTGRVKTVDAPKGQLHSSPGQSEAA